MFPVDESVNLARMVKQQFLSLFLSESGSRMGSSSSEKPEVVVLNDDISQLMVSYSPALAHAS